MDCHKLIQAVPSLQLMPGRVFLLKQIHMGSDTWYVSGDLLNVLYSISVKGRSAVICIQRQTAVYICSLALKLN